MSLLRPEVAPAAVPHVDLLAFLPSLGGGGTERAVLGVLGALAEDGVHVLLVVGTADGPYRREVPSTITLDILGTSRVSRAIPALARRLRTHRPSVVFTAMRHANVAVSLAVALTGARHRPRVVLSERSSVREARRRQGVVTRCLLDLGVRLTYPRAQAVVAVSQGVADELRAELGARRPTVLAIRNAALTATFRASLAAPAPHPWLAPDAPPVLLAAGRLHPCKGFDTLLDAFATVRATRPCRLVILGEGGERTRLEARARTLGVADDVLLPGFEPTPGPWMRHATVFVLSSRYEGMPNVLVQALGAGRPIVATDCAHGPAEVLERGRWGRLVPVDDADALAAACAQALDAPAPAVPDEVLARFDLSAVLDAWRTVLGLPASESTKAVAAGHVMETPEVACA